MYPYFIPYLFIPILFPVYCVVISSYYLLKITRQYVVICIGQNPAWCSWIHSQNNVSSSICPSTNIYWGLPSACGWSRHWGKKMTETDSLPSRKPYHRQGNNYNKKIITIYVISARIQWNKQNHMGAHKGNNLHRLWKNADPWRLLEQMMIIVFL